MGKQGTPGKKSHIKSFCREILWINEADYNREIFEAFQQQQRKNNALYWWTGDYFRRSQRKGKGRCERKKHSFRKQTFFDYVEDSLNFEC
jgi:hypothetical protein